MAPEYRPGIFMEGFFAVRAGTDRFVLACRGAFLVTSPA